MASPDVAIIGGGIIGLSAAVELAGAGLNVAVYDQGELGREASWAGAGILPPWGDGPKATPFDELRAFSVRRFATVMQELQLATGIDPGYRTCGGYELAPKSETERIAAWEREGIDFSRDAIRFLHRQETAYHFPQLAQVRNPWLLRAFVRRCEQLGVRLHPRQPLAEWRLSQGRVNGMNLANGESLTAGQYIIAAGAWADSVLEPLNAVLGIHPVRGQIVLLNVDPRYNVPMVIAGKQYLVPREDGLVLIGSTEEAAPEYQKASNPESIAALITFAKSLAPSLMDHATIETTWTGLRPASADGYPTIARVPGQDNVLAAVGHFRSGIQLSLGTAVMLRELILNQPASVHREAFAFGRCDLSGLRPTFQS